ncbi:HAMP domain-containing histidine kinase [Cryomorpha ignava]|uniref:histidine kinase n=1 Tax=Cryomorpha ignava TaxID=101383 RepID=A0A7K3WTI2_9FLAO|nr:HAMP domain-containing sensor histidine kinase [Cryomorpha ignava]NEN24858.1 HAMP domain-containing histidine kinase [Cryomorpha ignava]
MEIRKRLTFLFVGIVAIILLLSSLSIFYFSSNYRQEDFYNRLRSKGRNTAKLLIEVEEVDAELLLRIELDNPESLSEEKIIIYNFANEILFNTDRDNIIQISSYLLDEIRLQGEVRFETKGYEVLGAMYTDRYDRFVVITAAKDTYGLSKLKNLRNILFIVFISGIGLASLTGWLYAGRALRPISRVVSEVDRITISSLNLRLKTDASEDEIARLATTFNKMLDRLEKAFKMQKDFISNASHELRTPLTAITGQIEVLLLKERSTSEYSETLHSVLDDIKNLNHTSNRLLLLAQASSESAISNLRPVRVDELIWQARTEVLKRSSLYQIKVNVAKEINDENKFLVNGNEQLLKTVLINLMDNGCKYSDNHTVEVSMYSDSGNLKTTFANTGIGIHSDDIHLIWEPFHRGRNALQRRGHGIGLSLVKRITEIHDGHIEVTSELNKGAVFILYLPNLNA